jgi:hypothetical protein
MENETNHTPAPWNVQDNTAEPYGQLTVDSAAHGAVAICYTMEKGETVAPAECVQNARLISAAPDLLEALKVAESELRYHAATRNSEALTIVRAAIQKATGGEQ